MSTPKGIRLWLRPARGGRASVWIIRDGTSQKSTGCGPREIERAQQALAAYIAAQHRPQRAGGRDLARIPVADVIAIYADEVAIKKAKPRAVDARLRKLLEFFGIYMLSDINKRLCRDYVAHREGQTAKARQAREKKARAAGHAIDEDTRTAVQAARRELEDLRAATNYFFEDETLPPEVHIDLPEKSLPRSKWLTEAEAARLLWTAWRKKQPMPKGGFRSVARHVARFILVGLYTGTRSAAICGAAIRPTVGRGYVDLDRGVFYRRAPSTRETSKRQPSIRLPDKLLAHMRRWARLGLCANSIVEWNGSPVLRVSKAFRRIAKDAGLPDVTPHTLRHTAITWAKQRGVKSYDAAEYFGVSEKLIAQVYGHHDPEHHKEVTARMDRKKRQAS